MDTFDWFLVCMLVLGLWVGIGYQHSVTRDACSVEVMYDH